jgi:glucokinase
MAETRKKRKTLYVGVDVGGTKVQATLARADGEVLARNRCATPRDCGPDETVKAIGEAILSLLADARTSPKDLAAVGLAIPGVCDVDAGRVVVTPNMNLTGVEIVKLMRKQIDVPITLGNDVNCGTLGEVWLGTGRNASSVVGIFVGTGIGGGVFVDGKLHRGSRESAGEIGHLVMQIGGPQCGCGSLGCFEAIASRTAMERDIRAAIASGRTSIVTELLGGEDGLIRSGTLGKALAAGDEVVTEVMTAACEVMGYACLSIRHLVDPEVLLFGGGVVEACGHFMLPIIERIVESDPLTGARPGGRVLESALGDDAVALGAVALAQQAVGRNPFRGQKPPKYPKVKAGAGGKVGIGRRALAEGAFVDGDGVAAACNPLANDGRVRLKVLRRACQGCPTVLFVAGGDGVDGGEVALDKRGRMLLRYRNVELRARPRRKALRAYNDHKGRKALIVLPRE